LTKSTPPSGLLCNGRATTNRTTTPRHPHDEGRRFQAEGAGLGTPNER
jgi:hypothetical protein